MSKIIPTIAALAMSAAMMAAPAQAAGVKVGTLTCDAEAGWGLVLGSQKDLNCAFKSATINQISYHTGDVTKLGIDIGYTNAGVMVRAVVAPSTDMQPDALEGKYAGASVGATAAVGGNLNAMIGGLDKSFTLQPLSVEGNTGVSVTTVIGAMELNHVKR